MRILWVLPLLAVLLLGAVLVPSSSHAARAPDAAVGVWVVRTHPRDDVAGARVVVTARHGRPARQVLWGDGEGMAFADLWFRGGTTLMTLTIAPEVPPGMQLADGGCDRKKINRAATGEAPYDVPARGGQVVITLRRQQSASCIFVLAPSGAVPDTAAAATPVALGHGGPTKPVEPLALLAWAGASVLGVGLVSRRVPARRRPR